ncbi:MAG TPA: helix-turn-helix domain-containing protein [Sphingomicrobium sp.]|nr:helix-turn-helix domain-containing protein [Sphingomicrobium sp.]
MAKRDPESEPVDEAVVESDMPTVGERLRAAREEKKLALEDIAAQTRIPLRHLESIEAADWDHLPAPTYTVGFAKSYAGAVGLDRTEVGDQLREEMGGQRFATSQTEVLEAADPARTMPKWLVIGAVIAVILLITAMSLLNRRSLNQSDEPTPPPAVTAPAQPAQPAAPAAEPVPQGQVTLVATGPAWIQVTDQGKSLFQGELSPGQTFAVPATAVAPLLKAGKPEALQIKVGAATAPQVGPPGKVASNVSLKPADLMRGPAQPPAAAPATGPAAPVTNSAAQ